MALLGTILISILFGFTPLLVSFFLLSALCQVTRIAVPRSFLISHVVMASLARPLLDLIARVWLMQPILPLAIAAFTASTISLLFAGAIISSIILFMVFNVSQNVDIFLAILSHGLSEVNPFCISGDLRHAANVFGASVETFLDKTNFTELFQNVAAPPNQRIETSLFTPFPFFTDERTSDLSRFNFTEAMLNLTMTKSTVRNLDKVSKNFVDLLIATEVETVFNTTRIPRSLQKSLANVSDALHDIADNMNLTQLVKQATVPPSLKKSIGSLVDAMEAALVNLNYGEILLSASQSPATQDALIRCREMGYLSLDPTVSLKAFITPAGAESLPQIISAFSAWLPAPLRYGLSSSVLLSVFGLHVMFVLRASLQDACIWLVNRRYKYLIPEAERCAAGWMFMASLSALCVATAEAFPFCLLCGALYASNVFSMESSLLFLSHMLAALPLRAASQMRIAEADVRSDKLGEPRPGYFRGFVLSGFVNMSFNVLWLWFSIVLVIPRAPMFVVFIYVVVAGLSVLWGRAIRRRVIRAEQLMIESRNKRD